MPGSLGPRWDKLPSPGKNGLDDALSDDQDDYDEGEVDTVEEAEAALDSLLGGSALGVPLGPSGGGAAGAVVNMYALTDVPPHARAGVTRGGSEKGSGYFKLHEERQGSGASAAAAARVEPLEISLAEQADGDYEAGHVRDGKHHHHGRSGHGRHHVDWMSDIWAAPNRAVPASYFCVGIAMSFLRTPVSYYLVHELGASPSQQNVVVTLAMLPWSFKLVYGFISDNFPIGGMRRKPYFIAGWFIYSMCNLLLAATGRPGVQSVALLQLLGTCGFMMSDVTTDAIIVERSKNEPEETRGSMQATGYATRFCGSLLGSVLGTCVYNKERWGWGMTIGEVFLLNGLFPLLVVAPFMWTLRESAYVPRPGDRAVALRAQCDAIFTALSLRSVFVPMAVVFTYNLFQVPNAAWRSFLVEGLKFESFDLGLIGIVGSLFSSCGLIAYKRCFMGTGWRTIYRVTTTLTCFFSVVQLLLIFRVNQRFGVGDLAFALGDDALAEFVSAIQFLPVCQMYISMCPEGTEGTTYAILTTLSNVAGAVSFSIGTLLTHLWDVSNEAFAAGQFGGMWRLTLLTSLIQPLPLVLMGYLPANAEQQRAMQGNKESYRWGGTAFLVVLFGSLAWTIIESLIVIL